MAKTKVSEWDSTPGNNTDIDSINIAEGCAPSGINNAIRELMSQVKDFQQGTYSDPFNGPVNGTIGATTASSGAFTTLTASSTATLNTLASSGATLTGGSINNMAIGGSTAAAGAFTTLAASGAVTLSGGTANGVPYLNGSKVLTSGSALTFDGSALSASGNITSGGVLQALTTVQSSSGADLRLNANGANRDHIYQINGSEQMRLTSTGLGIGTSSPQSDSGYKSLTLNGTSGGQVGFKINDTLTHNIYGDSSALALVAGGSAPMKFIMGITERMRLDSSGNLGLGVTPSAWTGGAKAFEIAGGSVLSFGTGALELWQNAYFDGTTRYKVSAAASTYVQTSGQHRWFTAPSGTAGNAISFTQAMTLDASGQLGIGTSSPSVKLHAAESSSGGAYLRLENTRTATFDGDYFGQVQFNGNDTDGSGTRASIAALCRGASGQTDMVFSTAPAGGSNTERARIDSSGNLLVATTSQQASAKVTFQGAYGSYYPLACRLSSTNSDYQISFVNPNGIVGNITSGGSSTAYNTSSDYRLKENIQPMTGALERNALLKPCTYSWVADGSSGEGFIAHELQSVFSNAVTGEKDAVDANGNPVYQGVDTSFLVGHLVACIQELKAELDALKAKIG